MEQASSQKKKPAPQPVSELIMNPYPQVVHRLILPFILLGIFTILPATAYADPIRDNFGILADGTVTYSLSSYAFVYYPNYPSTSGSVLCGAGSSWTTGDIDIFFGAYNNCDDYLGETVIVQMGDVTHYDLFTGIAGGSIWTRYSDDDSTRIDTVDPAHYSDIATTSLPYDFEVTGYINASDYDSGTRVLVKVDRNTDQQAVGALLAFDSAFGNKTYLDVPAAGSFTVGTSSDNLRTDFELREGLYNARWEIQSPRFHVFGFDLFYSTLVASTTRFTVGTTTAIDNIQLAGEDYINDLLAGSGDPLGSCQFSWFSSDVDFSLGGSLIRCMGGLLHWAFIPPPGALERTVQQFKDGFLTRAPWGYFTRIVSAISGGAAGTLPTLTAAVPISAYDDITIQFDLDDMVDGAADLSEQFQAPNGNTAREIIEPIIQLIVGLLVLMFIWKDVIKRI